MFPSLWGTCDKSRPCLELTVMLPIITSSVGQNAVGLDKYHEQAILPSQDHTAVVEKARSRALSGKGVNLCFKLQAR